MNIRTLLGLTTLLLASSATAQVPQMINQQGRVAVGGVNFDGTGQFKFALVDAGTNTATTAHATAFIDGTGRVKNVLVLNGGAGYTTPPTVTITDPGGLGSGATATAVVGAGGVITAINVTNAGSNYAPPGGPAVTIADPPPNYVYNTFWSNDGSITPLPGLTEPSLAVPLTVTKGLYSVALGDTSLANMTPIPPGVFNNADARLRVWFNDGIHGSQLLAPDQRLAAVGYAMMAATVSNGTIDASKIAAGAVGANQLAAGGVQSVNIAAGAVGSSQLALGAITAGNIGAGAVGSSQLASGAVTAGNIGAGQVVKALNGLTDAVALAAGANVTLTPSGNTLTIASTASGLGSVAHGVTLTGAGTAASPLNFAIPLSLSGSTDFGTGVLTLLNSSNGYALSGTSTGAFGTGVMGTGSTGVFGASSDATGSGMEGFDNSGASSGTGVYGNSSAGTGVYGFSSSGAGVYGKSDTGYAGQFVGPTTTSAASIFTPAVYGNNTSASSLFFSPTGVAGDCANGTGVSGNSTDGTGVFGGATNGIGVFGSSTNSTGVYGNSTNGRGVVGISSKAASNMAGVWGENTTSGGTGVVGQGDAANSAGVAGVADSGGSTGVYARGSQYGVYGTNSGSGQGVFGESSSGAGVYGHSSGGAATASNGVTGSSDHGSGVYGITNANSPTANQSGVFGICSVSNDGVHFGAGVTGLASGGSDNMGIHGIASSVFQVAGYFDGSVFVSTNLYVAGSKNFRIDHPLDPANKYLVHSCVESPDVKNIYDGVVTTDVEGNATVTLPSYFEALNRDFRYQLTVIGTFAQAIVSSEIKGNAFSVRTDKPNIKVSWQVTGVRQDAYIKAHPMVVEQDKPEAERGTYQHPVEHGQSEELGLAWKRNPELMKKAKEERAKQTVSVAISPIPNTKPAPITSVR